MARLLRKNATVTSSQVVDLTVADDLTVTDALTASTIDASTDFTIGGTVITDNTITDDGTLVIASSTATSFSEGNITNVGDIALDTISSDAGTSIGVTLGTDAGDDFNVDSGKFLVEGDTGLVSIGTGGDFETSSSGNITDRGACFHSSTNRNLVFGY